MNKKVIVGFAALALLCGCDKKEEIKENNTVVKQNSLSIYKDVINGNKSFYNLNNNEDTYIDDIKSFKDSLFDEALKVKSFVAMDIDYDGSKEIVLEMCYKSDVLGYIILDIKDDKFVGRYYNYRELNSIGVNGSFIASSAADETYFYKFDSDYNLITLAYQTGTRYFINDKEATSDEFESFINNKEKIEFLAFNNTNIKNIFE